MKTLAMSLLLLAPAALAVDVEGYVYTIDGTPVANASVTAGSQRAVTSEDGHFTVTAPADSVVAIEVRAASLPATRLLALAGDPPLTITLAEQALRDGMRPTEVVPAARAARPATPAPQERDRVITGAVRIGKKALANAPVIVHAISDTHIVPMNLTTDASGHYRVTVPAGRYMVSLGEGLGPRLRLASEGRMHTDSEMPIADLTKTKEAVMDIELVAAPMLTGRVVDAEGKPAGRVEVVVAIAGRPGIEFMHQPIVRTRPDGRFAVPAPFFQESEQVEIVATPPRHSAARSKPFRFAEAKEITITLPRYERVTVRVTDRDKKPLANASVAYAAADELVNYGNADVLLMPHLARRRMRANANGEVELQLAHGDYEFGASAPRHQPRTVSHRVNKPGTVDVVLEAGHAIRGRVRRGEQPVAGVQVMIRGANVRRGEHGATTDEKGAFIFDGLAGGTYSVSFFKHDEMIDKVMTVDAPAELDVELPPTGVLRGRVFEATTREAIPQFVYTLESLDETEQTRVRGGRMQRGGSGLDGMFTTTVPAGRYRVIVAASGFIPSEPVEVQVNPQEPSAIEVPLGRGAAISGRVVDETGKPLVEAQVMIVREMGEISRSARAITRTSPLHAQTGEDGTFSISGAETGPAQLIVRRSGYVPDRREIDIQRETRIDVTLTRGLSLSGIVTLRGKPVANAQIGASTSAIGSDHQSATTDERGRFTLEGLIAARYMISASRENDHVQIPNVDVSQQRELVIELDDKGRGIVYGTVTGLPRIGPRQARGSVFVQSAERGAEGPIDENGNFRIENAPAGALDIVAHVESAQGGRSSARRKIELAPGQTLRADLDLTPAITVTGRVTHGGKPIEGAQLMFSSDEHGMSSAVSRTGGTYEIGLPSPGRYRVFVNADDVVSRHFQTVREVRSSETFDIQLFEQTVEGMVFDGVTHQPLAHATVTLVPKGASQHVSSETSTDASGRFTMTNTASGPHQLIAWAAGYGHQIIEMNVGTPAPVRVNFELTPATELRVRVADARTGTPLEAHLVITSQDGTFLPVRPIRTPDGTEFVFSVRPGKYNVKVVTPGYAEKSVDVTAPGTSVIAME